MLNRSYSKYVDEYESHAEPSTILAGAKISGITQVMIATPKRSQERGNAPSESDDEEPFPQTVIATPRRLHNRNSACSESPAVTEDSVNEEEGLFRDLLEHAIYLEANVTGLVLLSVFKSTESSSQESDRIDLQEYFKLWRVILDSRAGYVWDQLKRFLQGDTFKFVEIFDMPELRAKLTSSD